MLLRRAITGAIGLAHSTRMTDVMGANEPIGALDEHEVPRGPRAAATAHSRRRLIDSVATTDELGRRVVRLVRNVPEP